MDCRERAACRGLDPAFAIATFFPEQGASAEAARGFCDSCPVRRECLAYALAAEDLHGVWAGTSSRQRKRLRRAAS